MRRGIVHHEHVLLPPIFVLVVHHPGKAFHEVRERKLVARALDELVEYGPVLSDHSLHGQLVDLLGVAQVPLLARKEPGVVLGICLVDGALVEIDYLLPCVKELDKNLCELHPLMQICQRVNVRVLFLDSQP